MKTWANNETFMLKQSIDKTLVVYMKGVASELIHKRLLPDQLEQLMFTDEHYQKIEHLNCSSSCLNLFRCFVQFSINFHNLSRYSLGLEIANLYNESEKLFQDLVTSSPEVEYTYVKCWLKGSKLEPDEITRQLEIPPDWIKRPQEPNLYRDRDGVIRTHTNVLPGGHWLFKSSDWVYGETRLSLNHHIQWILEQLEGKEDVLLAICESGVSASLFCVCSTWDCETDLVDPALRKQVEAMGISISVHAFEPAWG